MTGLGRYIGGVVVACALWVLSFQELLLFPLAWYRALPFLPEPVREYHPETERIRITTEDQEQLMVLRRPADQPSGVVGIVFHGNGETVHPAHFLPYLGAVGVTAYGFDYRGYGESTGFPSQAGLRRDADAVWRYVVAREKVTPDRVVLLGNSMGSGLAAYLAQKHQVAGFIAVAGFSQLSEVVRGRPWYRPLVAGLRIDFPVLPLLQRTPSLRCVIVAHGAQDTVVPVSHAHQIASSLVRNGLEVTLLEDSRAGHNDIYYAVEHDLLEAGRRCVSNRLKPTIPQG